MEDQGDVSRRRACRLATEHSLPKKERRAEEKTNQKEESVDWLPALKSFEGKKKPKTSQSWTMTYQPNPRTL